MLSSRPRTPPPRRGEVIARPHHSLVEYLMGSKLNTTNNSEQLDPKTKLQQQTPATIAIANNIGAVKSRKFSKFCWIQG